jgi:hypothetical protein
MLIYWRVNDVTIKYHDFLLYDEDEDQEDD